MHELLRLRHRFILILMCSVGIVLTVALTTSLASSLSAQYKRIQYSLTAAQAVDGIEELRPWIGGYGIPRSTGFATPVDDQELRTDGPVTIRATEMVPVYIVHVFENEERVVAFGHAAQMDENTLDEALSRIHLKATTSGFFFDLGLFYSVQNLSTENQRIVFADASQLIDAVLNQSLIALMIWVIAMTFFLVVAIQLSSMVLRPIEEAWDTQHQFVADASHELKTPLTIILANLNVIMSHPEKPTAEQRKWLDSTEEEARRMNEMVSDLLLLAQIEKDEAKLGLQDGLEPFVENVDLSNLVEHSLLQFDTVFFERGLSSYTGIDKDIYTTGCQEHLRRLVVILLDNAAKYSLEGSTVNINLTRRTDKNSPVLLTVQNTSAAIPPEQLNHIFERFYRLDAAHSKVIEGNGIGLALAREIVHKHRGSISVTSKPLKSDAANITSTEAGNLAEIAFRVILP